MFLFIFIIVILQENSYYVFFSILIFYYYQFLSFSFFVIPFPLLSLSFIIFVLYYFHSFLSSSFFILNLIFICITSIHIVLIILLTLLIRAILIIIDVQENVLEGIKPGIFEEPRPEKFAGLGQLQQKSSQCSDNPQKIAQNGKTNRPKIFCKMNSA